MREKASSIRLWPAVLISALGAAAQGWAWLREELTRQMRVMDSLFYGVITLFLLFLWFLFLSRLAWKLRLKVVGALALLGGLFLALVEIRGVSGDLVPQLGWRWGSELASAPSARGTSGRRAEGSPPFAKFLGPHGDARLPQVRLSRDWTAHPPREVWRREVGAGWSSFAVRGGLAITQEQRGDLELVVAYDLSTGEPVWSHSDTARFDTTVGGVGPRATPTIAGDRVFTVGAVGLLNALDFETGEPLWQVDLVETYGSKILDWGMSSSPLVHEGQLIVRVGGTGRSLISLSPATGELLWQGGDEASSYSSPKVGVLAGREQILSFNGASITGHSLEDGAVLWRFPWSGDQPNVAQPVVLGPNRLLVSSGYGIGSALLELSSGPGSDSELSVGEIWQSRRLKLKFAQAVEHEGSLYGLDDGVLVCLDPETGERRWKRGRYGHGQILLLGDLLLVQTESGKLILVDPDPTELVELGSLEALSGHAWNTLAFSSPYLLLRNHEEAVAYELTLRSD